MFALRERSRSWLVPAVLAVAALFDPSAAVAQQKVLRVAMHADVRTLDPFWTTQTIASIQAG
ncbi:MAG: hypothetical protein IPO58_25165 [Betaproteobacteria bacterium]|nr:hypothetical protein [Betaproteobacteria bacterium]